jgi:phage/plasmid-like protein (TIGR03299 family)
MAHALEIVNGVASMFSARNKSPWHGLGHVVSEVKTAEEAIKLAGLDWHVNVEKVFTNDGKEVPGCHVTRRDIDGAILGVTGNRYNPLQNVEAFNFFDPFVKSGECSFETAGSLRGGTLIWILARINRDPLMIAGKDAVDKYVLLSNSHDGKSSTKAGFSLIRPVCANTLALAHNDTASQLIRVRHSANIVPNLNEIRMTMDTVDAEFKATGAMFDKMAGKGINKNDLAKYVCRVFDTPEDEPPRCLAQILSNFESGAGADVAGETMWGAYQATTEYLSNQQGRSNEGRAESNAYGAAVKVNEKALSLAYQYVTVGGF